ncbi:hypothetical protein EAH_00043600 [Eimeria acervulina]|uniref:Uncharacterized protein n=1 Tax=Eimeria acervulina TaxID=5801 RepID=U6GIR8_EIMAC|nr:hypothetical protein EAH_00043600 [Eimeria acervulina]CDI79477.1 hypothetical protein EAH_00043600 [Eimeria acervulina]
MIEHCKYDFTSVMIGLDFIGGVLEKEPKTRMEIYEMDGIAKLESVQFLHNEAIDKRVSTLISKYLDGFSEDEEEPPPNAFSAF